MHRFDSTTIHGHMPALSQTRLIVFALFLTAVLFAALMVDRGAGHDYIQFHAAATLLSARENPYGGAEQVRAQRVLRGGRELRELEPDDLYAGIGILPYFYPPWVALTVVPLTLLEYEAAKALWIFLGVLALVIAGSSMGNFGASRHHHRALTVALCLTFMPAFSAVEIGQVAPFVLLLLVACLRLLEQDQDVAAGFILAWLTIKPQLTVVVIPATLIWGARRARWKVFLSFAVTLGMLSLICAGLVADWPWRMIAAPREFPLPTSIDPSVGVTWLSLCQTLGLRGGTLAMAYAVGAIPAAVLTVRAAWDRNRPAAEILGRGVLAAFFVAPYSLGYDLATLLFPLLLVAFRLSRRAGMGLIAVAMLVPYWNLSAVQAGAPQVTFFWMPLALAALWFRVDRGEEEAQNRLCQIEGSREV